MRVLHLISSGGMYGAEAVILSLSAAINATEHRVLLGVFSNTEAPNLELRDAARSAGIETHTIECRGQLDLAVPSRLLKLAQLTRSDVIHTHGYKANIYARWAFRKARIPLVATCHNWIDNDLALRAYGWLDRTSLRGFERVVAVSEGVRARLLGAGVRPERVRVIRNGIVLTPQTTTSRDDHRPLTVGLVGRLSPEKGVDTFINVAAIVLKQLPSTRFLIVGDGPERASLQALINQLGVSENVHLLGRRDDMDAVYRSLDVQVLSSRTEGLPMALLEGMSYGLPVVATQVGEIPAVIRNGDSGLLVEPDRTVEIAKAISTLLQDQARRYTMGTNARARIASEFSASQMAFSYIDVYREAIATRSIAA